LKKFIFKWFRWLYAFIAANLILIALLLTAARIASTDVNTYKVKIIEWIAAEHDINVNVENISAGVDFSGLVLTLKNVSFVDAPLLPFELELEHLFLHIDFINSIKQQTLVFNDISLKGADLVLKSSYRLNRFDSNSTEAASTAVTIDSLKNIFLSRLSSFSIKESQLNFTDHLSNQKTIYVEDLTWLNNGTHHQGVGKASLPDTLGENTLEFLIDITGDANGANDQLIANLYAHAENLNISDYLKPQINPLAELKAANVSFKLWSEFDFNGPKNLLVEWDSSEINWSLLGQSHDWKLNDGLLQFSYQNRSWLFDSYDLNLEYNYVPWTDVKLSGSGIGGKYGEFDIDGINLNTIVPFSLLFSPLSEVDIETVNRLEIGGELKTIKVTVDQPGELTIGAQIDAFNNQAVDVFPGISDANIEISSNKESGKASIILPEQNILFDGQFNRSMPVQTAELKLNWLVNESGVELSSDKVSLVTDDLTSLSQFSLFIPNQQATELEPFLSLYAYASLNDLSKAQHYFPIVALGQDVFDYLQPATPKGSVKGAKAVWYGSLTDYPFSQNNGVFQAFIPVKDAEYNFYEGWEGLSSLDLDMLFENDSMSMTSQKAKLGNIKLDSLVGHIDHLSEEGVISIKGKVEEDAQIVSQYFNDTPLKDSVGEALKIIHVNDKISGDIALTVPLNSENGDPVVSGVINLLNNDIDIKLGKELIIPLKEVNGSLNFVDGKLTAKGISANLFEQPTDFSFFTTPLENEYKINMDFSGQWDAATLSVNRPEELSLYQLSGTFDWSGDIAFTQFSEGTYNFDLNLSSPLQGMRTQLPIPYNKNALQIWPSKVKFSGNELSAKWDVKINNKIKLLGEVDYQTEDVYLPYAYFGLGVDQNLPLDYTKQVVRVNEDSISLTAWTPTLLKLVLGDPLVEKKAELDSKRLINIDEIYVDIKQAELFDEPLHNFKSRLSRIDNLWNIDTTANDLFTHIEYRKGIPDRFDVIFEKMNFQFFDVDNAVNTIFKKEGSLREERSQNLREDYPEIFFECESCFYQKMNFSNLSAHVFPSQSRYTIDYMKFNDGDEFTNISGVWDQRRTNVIFDSKVSSDTSIVQRLGYASPIIYQQAEITGALNWIGAPWQYNLESLNGELFSKLENGAITEVNDQGARLLSFLSLDAIRRSLNLEYGNVFSKGLGFDDMSFSSQFNNGVVKSDDFYLDGSAGKITGGGLIDLPNLNVNYRLSYSPAVTSSLPVLAAFAVNPLTGAAVLMLTKILEPVVDTIIRVDFSVKGSIMDPVVKMESSEKGKIKLQNSAVLEEIEDSQISQGSDDE